MTLLGAGIAAALYAESARAQVRSDASVDAGVVKRFVAGAGGRDAGFGPIVGIAAHIALLPLVRVGVYASAELSPGEVPANARARRMYAGGLRIKLLSPYPHDEVRAWVFAGLGLSGIDAPDYRGALTSSGGLALGDAFVPSAGGHFFEVPLGLGASYRLRKPWVVNAELTGRIGFAFSGSIYDGGRPIVDESSSLPASSGPLATAPAGRDVFALGLTVGIGFDR